MVNLDIEVRVNGKRVVMSEKLGDLISNYLLEQIGLIEQVSILDNIKPKKFPKAKVYGETGFSKTSWTEDETLQFIMRVEEIRKDGTSFSKMGKILSPEFKDRTPGALYQKIMELKRKGMIKIV